MNPIALYVPRPYATVEEFLEAEAWTIDARSILLLDQAKLEVDTPVVFDLCLSTGARVLRAEGRVAPSTGEGLRVRFRRYSTQAKLFIERAIKAREEQLARDAEPSSAPPAPETPVATAPEPVSGPLAASPAIPPPPSQDAPEDGSRASRAEPSGIQQRRVTTVAAPPNRDLLLERLRQRKRAQ